jgi:ribosomal protein S18 acetylase RimI-like enzyme
MKERKEILPEVNFRRYSKENRPSPEKVLKVAKLFAEVFAGPPWNEVDKWEENETSKMINDVFTKENPVMYLLEHGLEVLGFGWGYSKDNREYLPLFGQGGEKVIKDLDGRGSKTSFSLSEIGIKKSVRGKGYGKELVKLLMWEAADEDLPVTVWTRYDTILSPICIKNGFDQIYGFNVVLANHKSYAGVTAINGIDFRYPERVFFVK